MVKSLEVKNFKSLKDVKLKCKRVNLFIGEPNAGKSNILESVGIFSSPFTGNLKDFVRFERVSNLFYDENLEDNINIRLGQKEIVIKRNGERVEGKAIEEQFPLFSFIASPFEKEARIDNVSTFPDVNDVKFYRFRIKEVFPTRRGDFLLPPDGNNLFALVSTLGELKSFIGQVLKPFGTRLALRPQENKMEILKHYEKEDIFISLPYSLLSDTLQRIIFYFVAIETNKDSVIVFEEPESHAFPYYTKLLAERIALNKGNQYFLTTHNPYFLLSLLEKIAKEDIGVFVTYFKDYQTKVKELTEKEKTEILDSETDVFFNIEKFTEK